MRCPKSKPHLRRKGRYLGSVAFLFFDNGIQKRPPGDLHPRKQPSIRVFSAVLEFLGRPILLPGRRQPGVLRQAGSLEDRLCSPPTIGLPFTGPPVRVVRPVFQWGILVQAQVGPRAGVVFQVGFQAAAQVILVEDQHMIEARRFRVPTTRSLPGFVGMGERPVPYPVGGPPWEQMSLGFQVLDSRKGA